MAVGDLESWWERADWALGMAGQILQLATERYTAASLDLESASAAATIAGQWMELSLYWSGREEGEIAVEEEPEPARIPGQ